MFETPEFWVAVAFLILVGLIAKPVAKAATAALDGRTERIRKVLDDATRLREEAQHLLADYQRKQRDAAKEIDELIAAAEAEAKNIAAETTAKMEDSLRRREQLALDKIAQAEAEALQQVRDTAIDLAIAATRRLLSERLDEQAAARLVDDAIDELPARIRQ